MADGAIVRVTSDGVIYRASALGGCLKALLAARLGYPASAPPAKMQAIFDAGHAAEDPVMELLRDRGWNIAHRELRVRLPVMRGVEVVGHIDGLNMPAGEALYGPERALHGVEVKSQSAGEYEAYSGSWEDGLWAKYAWQLSVYMHAVGKPWNVVRYNRDTGQLSIAPEIVPPRTMDEIRWRVMQVEMAAARGVLSEDLPCTLDWPCPYWQLHPEQDRQTGSEKLGEYATAYVEVSQQIRKLEETKTSLRKSLIAEMTDDKMVTKEGIRVTRAVKSRAQPVRTIEDEWMVETEWDEIRITMPKEKRDESSGEDRGDGTGEANSPVR